MKTLSLALACTFAVAVAAPALHASRITHTTYDIKVTGSYTIADGQIHSLSNGKYRIFDLDQNGYLDGGGKAIPGFGEYDYDAFGVYDKGTNTFYAANSPFDGAGSIYTYTWNNDTWKSSPIANAYAAATYGGSLYVSGTKEPYGSGNASPNYISRFDNQTQQRHLLIETGGYSAPLFVAGNGDIYYGTSGLNQNALYRWSAAEVAAVDNADELDFLTLSEEAKLLDIDGGTSGLTIDDAGNIIFSTADYIAVVDLNSPEGYRILLDATEAALIGIDTPGYGFSMGMLAAEGDVLNGGELFFSPGYMADLVGIQVPEPSTYALIAGLASLLVVARLRRRR